MRLPWISALFATVAVALCGCDRAADGGTDATAVGSEPADAALLDAARQPLERARGVEDIAAGRKAALDEDIAGAAD